MHRHKPIMLGMALETRHHRSLLPLLIPLLSASFIFTCSYGYILGLHPLGTGFRSSRSPLLSRTPNGFFGPRLLSTGFSRKFILEQYPYAQSSCSSTIPLEFLKFEVAPFCLADEKYFDSEVIKCKDGYKSFTRDRVNDNFCDCVDGTDEPGTSACQAGKFYCRNVGSKPQFIFSSHINDRFCDCCDGSDEYDGSVHCANTCVMGGNTEYMTSSYISTSLDMSSIDVKQTKSEVYMEDLIQKLKGLKVLIILQVALIGLAVIFRIFHRRARSKIRRYR